MTIKINPFAQIFEVFRSFVSSDTLYNLRRQSTGSKIAYSAIISILTGLLVCILSAFIISTNKSLTQFMNNLPEFYYSNGEFYCEDRFEECETNTYVLIDTSQTQFTQEHVKSALTKPNISQVLLVSKTNIITYKSLTGEYQDMKISDFMWVLQLQSLSKQQVLSEYKGFIIKVAMLFSLIYIPYQFAKLFFVSLILALIALIINAACNTRETFSTLYWMSFYIQSAFMIILSIAKPLIKLKGGIFTIVCLVLFIFIMYRTLKHGEPVRKPVTFTNSNDDFDDFMHQDAYPIPPAAPSPLNNTNTVSTLSPFDTTNPSTNIDTAPYNSADAYPDSTYNAADDSNSTESSQNFSGLSLKKDN